MGKVREWTDYELGFIQDHEDWTNAQVAENLDRTEVAVKHKRNQIRSGWTPVKPTPWDATEDEFLLANPRMSAADVGAHIGRTAPAVSHRRQEMKRLGLVSQRFGGNWSPYVHGARPLLAKTCPKCGLLLQAGWFKPEGRSRKHRNRLCMRCNVRKVQRPDTENQKLQTRKSRERLQALTLPTATQAGQPWTETDLQVMQDPDMTILQKALRIRRTWKAVASACSKNGFKSHVGLGDPERDQWIIDNPNAWNVDEIAASLAPLNPLAPAEAKQPTTPQWDWDESDLKVSA